eukprot:4440520-Prymnesium_polylepis.1
MWSERSAESESSAAAASWAFFSLAASCLALVRTWASSGSACRVTLVFSERLGLRRAQLTLALLLGGRQPVTHRSTRRRSATGDASVAFFSIYVALDAKNTEEGR